MIWSNEHTHQFVVFFADGEDFTAAHLAALTASFSAPPPSGEPVGIPIRFADPTTTTALTGTMGGAMSAVTTYVWSSGAGIWKLQLQPNRLDLHFNAQGYYEVTGTAVSLHETASRVAHALYAAGEILERTVNRLAVVWKGGVRFPDPSLSPKLVATRMLAPRFVEAAEEGGLLDSTARVNHAVQWNADGQVNPVIVNRIAQGTSGWQVAGGVVVTPLTWMFDFNTSPLAQEWASFSADEVRAFLDEAVQWVESQVADVTRAIPDAE